MSKLAKILKAARERKGWGLREASRHSGISAATISKLESGEMKNPTFATLVVLKNHYKMTIKDFTALFDNE